ncbi:hypothetical protein EVJ33_04850 [Exiguobacterium sp. SL-10]|uniref:hypothetical protein n=1 Tax=Exiguobacterium sp. SL-10 TaxID=2510962 RepID=UPI001039864E|nr:hypothetical protein [Exiguobacterium sp. SL-10]TCI30631.1 hypothetical protein EVJ33_04850 [Exiguobacterium sp. SL-10]
MRPTPEAAEYSNEMFEGEMRNPKEDEQSHLKLDDLDYTFDSVTTIIVRGDGFFYWLVLLAFILLGGLVFAATSRFQHRKRADESSSLKPRTFSRHSVPHSMSSIEEPAWTGVVIRDTLIAFHQTLPPTKKWVPSETLSEWARRIGLIDTDFKPYLDERYGMTDPVTPEQVARFRKTLEQYKNRLQH